MLASAIPTKFPIPFANAAGGSFIRVIPQASQISIQAGAASLTDGFPPVCFQPVGSGGVPPFGQDMNGLLNQITKWNQWQQAGGPVGYDSSFATSISGYPKGAVLASATFGGFWINQVDSNSTNPDSGGTNWISVFAPVFISPTFSGTATFGGPLVANSTVTLGAGFSTPNSTGSNSSGNYVVNQLQNNNVSFINPANSSVSFENPFGTVMQAYYSGSASNIAVFQIGQNTVTGQIMLFNYRGSPIGGITNTTTSVAYGTTSDYRLKTDLEPITGALARVAAIPVYRGHFIGHEELPKVDMFVAHELQVSVPEAVSGLKDAMTDVGDIFVPIGTIAQSGVDRPDALADFLTWTPTGNRPGPMVAGIVGNKPGMVPGPVIPTGDVSYSSEVIIQGGTPEPHGDDLRAGAQWRKTGTTINPQSVDQSKVVPLLVAAVQELKALVDAMAKRLPPEPASA